MKLTILGCSGSLAAPGNPASGYLVEAGDATRVLMDLGQGTLAAAQAVGNPADAHVLLSHLHPDHCLDFPSLLVWRRYHPSLAATERHRLRGPSYTPTHLGRLSSDDPDGVDDFSDTFDFAPWRLGAPETLGELTVTAYPAIHPVEAYILRVEEPATGATLCYSGDTAHTDALIAAAQGVDLFVCEAGWGPDGTGAPGGMHLSGAEAGWAAQAAGVNTLVLVHLQPWADVAATRAAAATEFAGEIIVGAAGMVIER